MFRGKKTYILAAISVVYGVTGFFGGFLDPQVAGEAIFGGVLFAALRNGMR